MNSEINDTIELLKYVVRRNSGSTTVSVNVFISSEGVEVVFRTVSPESLKADGISMRNINGEFIN